MVVESVAGCTRVALVTLCAAFSSIVVVVVGWVAQEGLHKSSVELESVVGYAQEWLLCGTLIAAFSSI